MAKEAVGPTRRRKLFGNYREAEGRLAVLVDLQREMIENMNRCQEAAKRETEATDRWREQVEALVAKINEASEAVAYALSLLNSTAVVNGLNKKPDKLALSAKKNRKR